MWATTSFNVIIEGNIGSGKSTFLEHFKGYEEICTVPEPVDDWTDFGGINLLQRFYDDPKEWATKFHASVLLTMFNGHNLVTDKRIKLMERSFFSVFKCFIPQMCNKGYISQDAFCVFSAWATFIGLTDRINTRQPIDLIVYLKTTPEVVYERMKKRARAEEATVTLEYLRELHDLHEKWLMSDKNHIPVLVLDGDKDGTEMLEEYQKFTDRINSEEPGPLTRQNTALDLSVDCSDMYS